MATAEALGLVYRMSSDWKATLNAVEHMPQMMQIAMIAVNEDAHICKESSEIMTLVRVIAMNRKRLRS